MQIISKEWVESRVDELNEIETRKSLAPATKKFLKTVIRLGKGILSAFDEWLESVG